jgi:hypothetical protein
MTELPNIEQLVWDEIVAELKEIHDKHLVKVLYGDFEVKYNRPMNAFEKLQSGWWWTGQIFEEWCYTMTHDEQWEFFEFLQTDYVGYEESEYYE